MGLGIVLDEQQTVAATDVGNVVGIGAAAIEVDNHDGASAPVDSRFEACVVNLQRVRVGLYQYSGVASVSYPLTGAHIEYALYDGKFVRSIAAPDRDCSTDELAAALSEYIKLFDKLMKAYLAGRLDEHDVEAAYYSQMRNSPVHI